MWKSASETKIKTKAEFTPKVTPAWYVALLVTFHIVVRTWQLAFWALSRLQIMVLTAIQRRQLQDHDFLMSVVNHFKKPLKFGCQHLDLVLCILFIESLE